MGIFIMQVSLLMLAICIQAECHVADLGDEFYLYGVSQKNPLDCSTISDLRYKAYRYIRFLDEAKYGYHYYAREQLWRDHYIEACHIERMWLKLDLVMSEWYNDESKQHALKELQKGMGKVAYYQGMMPEIIEVTDYVLEEYDEP